MPIPGGFHRDTSEPYPAMLSASPHPSNWERIQFPQLDRPQAGHANITGSGATLTWLMVTANGGTYRLIE